jgi:hypothetical protein
MELALPAFTDKDIWMLHDGARALVVDPGDVSVQAHEARHPRLATILVTWGNRDIVAHTLPCGDKRSRGRATRPSTIERASSREWKNRS